MIELSGRPSFPQERIWFLAQLDPGDRSYQFQASLTFDGALDVEALEDALDTIVARHEIFRMRFAHVDGVPVAHVVPAAKAAFEIVDLAPGERAGSVIADALAREFDVTRLPLVRWTLVRESATRHVLVHVEHHLVHDGWSFNLFLEELTQLYRAAAAGRAHGLATPPSFLDYVRRQRERADTPAARDDVEFWKRTLAGAPPLTGLPTDRQRPPRLTHSGDAVISMIPPQVQRAIERLARDHAATPFMLMFAAFLVLLARYSGEDDLCIGTGAAARDTPEAEGLIGMLVTTLVLRTDLGGDPAFLTLLERVRAVLLEAYAHQDVPFDRIVEAVAPVRDPSLNPLFNVLFAFHDSREPALDFGELIVELDRTMDNGSAKTDLNVVCVPRAHGMMLKWEYNRDLFDRPTIERMAAHFDTVLARVLDEPERRISRFDLMREPERRLVLETFAENHRPYPRDESLTRRFASIVASLPDRPSLVADAGTMSYLELDRRANRLARTLQARGVRPGMHVGLLLERSTNAVVAMLAVLKTGAAYVPLDERYPRERVAWLLEDASVALTITHGELAARLPAGAPVVHLATGAAEIAAQPEGPLPECRAADAVAYVMYTSGSTGRPKGVRIPDRGVMRLVTSGDWAQPAARDVGFHYASYAFDASTLEIWGALLNGAALAIAPPGMLSLAEIGTALANHAVTVAVLTTPLFHQFVDDRLDAFAGLRTLMVGGDVMSPAHALRCVEAYPAMRLINGYGPTENTAFTTVHAVARADAQRKSIPIGRPVANTSVYVLSGRTPAALDVPGELWTGGDGVALGYLNRDDLTADRFVDDPFSTEPGARIYGTGDIVRWRADGTLEFLGRRDGQAKIRGFRVEIGAVESTLRSHPAVDDVSVSVLGPLGGDRLLVAHVATGDGDTDASALKAFLRERLPEYEVPSQISVHRTLPSSVGGKVDRAGLAAADANGTAPVSSPGEAFQGDVEERLGSIWCEILRLPSVGRSEDFFDLGGHSLMIMRVAARIVAEFNVELSLRTLFERRTIAQIAGVIAEATPLAPLEPESIDLASLTEAEIDELLRSD